MTTTAKAQENMAGTERWPVRRTVIVAASVFCAAVLTIAPRLALSPDQPMRFTGFSGGPFSPVSAGRSIRSGILPVAWRLTGLPAWIDATGQSGVLSMASERPVQLRPNAAAARLQPGIYQAEIGIVSSSLSAVPAIQVLLEVKPPVPGRQESSRLDRSQLGKSIENISCAASVGRWNDYDVLSGFVDSLDSLDRIKQIANSVPGTLLGDVSTIGAGPCNIVRSLGKRLFADPAPGIDIGPSDVFYEGDTLKIEIHAPHSSRYLEAFYLQADGTVRHLTANGGALPPGRETLVFGDGVDGRRKFTVGAPFGQEMILALASSESILGPEVPATQSSVELADALSNAFSGEAAPTRADRSVTASAKFLSVRGR